MSLPLRSSRFRSLLPGFVLYAATACSGGTSAGRPAQPEPSDAAPAADTGARGTPDSGSTRAGGNTDAAVRAAKAAAETDPNCTAIDPFYFELGNAEGMLGGESPGGNSFTQTTDMEIASASKWLFGAYVVERFRDDLSKIDDEAMTMRSGYTSFVYSTCLTATTVESCFDSAKNSTYTAKDQGLFYYGGGHFQKYAVDLGMGAFGDDELTSELKSKLGAELDFAFRSPQLAAGVHASAAGYAGFLRKILGGGLAISEHLGGQSVCTLPATCPSAESSPAAPEDWHYSYGHWVEDDPTNGDGAFSSPGYYGFYPFIDASKKYYGIVARYSLKTTAYIESAKCGRVIRDAFLGSLAK